jgi:tetratricopeptide (TPR) repeat protein
VDDTLSISSAERITIFVSSRIGECRTERGIARDAIKSLNHVPILFEDLGAHPYPARETYEPRLRTSQIFVGIYRDGYGEIGPGMTISGLEDEFSIAREVGLPQLVYARRDAASREPRLTTLIEQAKKELTVCFYDDPAELRERLRDDITAVVAQSFHTARQIDPAIDESPSRFLDRLVPSNQRLARSDVERGLIEALHSHHVVEVQGELGVGKTVLIAGLAVAQDFVFISGQGESPTQIAMRIANKLRAKKGQPATLVRSYDAALTTLRDAWRQSPRTIVAIDACPRSKLIDDIVTVVGAPSSDYPLIFSISGEPEGLGFHRFRVPRLKREEVADLSFMRFGSRPSPEDLARLVELSRGIPLYLRYVRTASDIEIKDSTLETIELRRWRAVSSLSRDIVTYVCLSDQPLALDDLISLTGGSDLTNAIEQASVLVLERTEGFTPVHQHLRTTIRAELLRSPARHAYYAAALGKHLAESGDYSSAFFVFDRAGLPDAIRVIARASFDAGQQGDFRKLTRILNRRIDLLEPSGPSHQFCAVIVALAHAEDAAGEAESAKKRWQEAQRMAGQLGDSRLRHQIRAGFLSREALTTASPASLQDLAAQRDELLSANEDWLAGSVALDLSTIFIRIGREKEGAENARIAATKFDAIGDTYGADLARRNLASALSQIPGQEDEAKRLSEEFTLADTSGSKRLHAFRCNLLFMAARKHGDNERARALALEALAIGEELQDVWVVITNTINLANVERDEGRSSEAIRLYNKVSEIAQRSALRTTEAIASRHAAEVHNQRKEFGLAKNYAEYAVGLLRDSAATVEFSIAQEERADAEAGLGDPLAAAASYLGAAECLVETDHRNRRGRLISQAAAQYLKADNPVQYFKDFGKFYGCPEGEALGVALALVEKLSAELPCRGIFGALNVHFRFIFRDAPPAICRRLFRIIADRIVNSRTGDSRRCLAFIPLLAASPAAVLDLQMLVELADGLHRAVKTLSFKPSGDLALNYVVDLDLGGPAILSFMQIDDVAESAAVATILALLFLGFQEDIARDVLNGKPPERSEVNISVVALSEVTALKIALSLDADQTFGVTRPADLREAGIPTFVVYRDGLLGTWEKHDYIRGLLGLLATVLLEVTFQLLKAEVESDTLHRSILGIVRNLL